MSTRDDLVGVERTGWLIPRLLDHGHHIEEAQYRWETTGSTDRRKGA
jgi:hypothetical protein